MIWERWVDAVAADLDRDGVAAHEQDVATFAALARRWCPPAAVLDVVTDPSTSEIARLRAFGMLAAFTVNREAPADNVAGHDHRASDDAASGQRRLPFRSDVPVGVPDVTVDA